MHCSSSTAQIMSVLRTLWIQGTCLSPMPSMRWPPKPHCSSVGHCRASVATTRSSGCRVRMEIARRDRAGAAGGGDVRRQPVAVAC